MSGKLTKGKDTPTSMVPVTYFDFFNHSKYCINFITNCTFAISYSWSGRGPGKLYMLQAP